MVKKSKKSTFQPLTLALLLLVSIIGVICAVKILSTNPWITHKNIRGIPIKNSELILSVDEGSEFTLLPDGYKQKNKNISRKITIQSLFMCRLYINS